jgi:hypothetical protein
LTFTISDEWQKKDMLFFIQTQIVAPISLALAKQEAIQNFVLAQSDSIFLAAQLARRAVVQQCEEWRRGPGAHPQDPRGRRPCRAISDAE